MQNIKEKNVWKCLNSSEAEMEVKSREFGSNSDCVILCKFKPKYK